MTIFNLNIDGETIPNEWRIERMKIHRNDLLTQSDWTQTADNPISNKAAWATYRQQLRDFPATWTPADTVEFPDPPS
jgi:hypothetical protein